MKTLGLFSFVFGSLLCISTPAYADFVGDFSVEKWTIFTELNGSIDTTNAPSSIHFVGGYNDSPNDPDRPSSQDFIIAIPLSGVVMFDWDYETTDCARFDPFGYLVNGNFTQLTVDTVGVCDFETIANGSESVVVNTGDIFGFRQHATDSQFGPGETVISKFSMTPVPEPSTIMLLGTGLAGIIAWRRKTTA